MMLIIRVLIHTDLPEPVAPAISRWGIFPMSVTTTCPPISLPTAKARRDLWFLNDSASSKSLRYTMLFSLLGTSIPTADLPGMGASIRISAAARLSLISSVSPTILLTFTPCSGKSSYRVTAGPQLIFVTVTPTPKLWRVCCSLMAVALYSSPEKEPAFLAPFLSRLVGGNTYSFFTASSFSLISWATAILESVCPASSRFFSIFFWRSSVSVSITLPDAVTTRLGSSGTNMLS